MRMDIEPCIAASWRPTTRVSLLYGLEYRPDPSMPTMETAPTLPALLTAAAMPIGRPRRNTGSPQVRIRTKNCGRLPLGRLDVVVIAAAIDDRDARMPLQDGQLRLVALPVVGRRRKSCMTATLPRSPIRPTRRSAAMVPC